MYGKKLLVYIRSRSALECRNDTSARSTSSTGRSNSFTQPIPGSFKSNIYTQPITVSSRLNTYNQPIPGFLRSNSYDRPIPGSFKVNYSFKAKFLN